MDSTMYGADIRSRSAGWTTLMYGASFSWLCALWVVGRWRSSGSLACDFPAEELRRLCHPHWRCPPVNRGGWWHIGPERRLMSSQMHPKAKVCTLLYHPLNSPPVRVVTCNVICPQNSGFEFACLLALTVRRQTMSCGSAYRKKWRKLYKIFG